jgi:uncharacterized protein YlxW (UPF0749 family)
MKNRMVFVVVCLLSLSTVSIAQGKSTVKVNADSVALKSYQDQKEQLVQKIVQVQSDLLELKEQREKYYNELSQLNIAIMLYEEKTKNNKTSENKK